MILNGKPGDDRQPNLAITWWANQIGADVFLGIFQHSTKKRVVELIIWGCLVSVPGIPGIAERWLNVIKM